MEALTEYVKDGFQTLSAHPTRVIFGVVGIGFVIYVTKKYFGGGVCYSKATLHGKTVIITGANTGIGLETAVDLAKRGARVVLACRSVEKGQAAVEAVKSRSKNENVVFVKLDLASLKSVRDFSDRVLQDEVHIDILINNAGVMVPPYTKTEDGFELQIGVNHLAHFLLTNLLLERIKETPSSRIINVSSLAHRRGKINFDDLQSEQSYSPMREYAQSKLANVLFTQSLAKRMKGTNATAYSLHPGAVRTELGRHINVILRIFIIPIQWLFFKSSWQGAQTSIYCAVTEGLEKESGKYFSDCKVKAVTNPQACDDAIAERLWEVSAQLVGLD